MKKLATLTKEQLSDLERNNAVCDDATLRTLWSAQAILSIVNALMESDDSDFEGETFNLALQGAERLLVGAIRNAGWEGAGWSGRS